MSFSTGSGGTGSISGSNDVALSSPTNSQVLAYDSSTAKWRNSSISGTSQALVLNSQSTSAYALVISDAGKIIETTGSTAVTITVPPNSSVAFEIGTTIALRQYGSGQLTVAAGSGVTIQSRGAVYKIGGQYGEAVITKRTINEWILSGDLTA